MAESLTRKLTDFFLSRNFFDEKDYKYYYFGFKHMISELEIWLLMFAEALIFGKLWQAVVFMISFTVLRHCCGGFHAKTRMRCNIAFMSTYTLVLLVILLVPNEAYIPLSVIGTVISDICIYIYAPIESENKKCAEDELIRFRKKAIIYSLALTVIVTAGAIFLPEIGFCVMLGMLNAALSLAIASILKRG